MHGSKSLKKAMKNIVIIMIAAIMALVLIPPVPAKSAGSVYLDEVVGISRDQLIKQLQKHEKDKYYNGAPYWGDDFRNSYGDPYHRYGSSDISGVPAFNCTGFVWRALVDSGAKKNKIPVMSGCYNCWQNPTKPGRNTWWRYIKGDAGFTPVYYRYTSVSDLLAAGKAEKGDIIYMLQNGAPSPKTGIIDCHVGIFWGGRSGRISGIILAATVPCARDG